jgi:peptide/nickel transport system permease protein
MTVENLNLGAVVTGQGEGAPSEVRVARRRFPYLRYVARRLGQSVLLFALTIIMVFTMMNVVPGDMVDVMAGDSGGADPSYVSMLREKFGLDKPIPVRLYNYVDELAHLNLGYSFPQSAPVSDLVAERVGPTLLLVCTATALAVCISLVLALMAAVHVHRSADRIISVVMLVAYATPSFWIGLMLILIFSVRLDLLPSSGMETLFSGYTGWTRIKDLGLHLILPAVTLAFGQVALYTRMLRASLLEVMRQDFIRTARAKGISELRVLISHTLRNALLPLVTIVGMHIGASLGGAMVVETVFAWPGLGRLASDALAARDTNLLVGIVLFSGLLVITANFVVDVLYGWLDPRIEVR